MMEVQTNKGSQIDRFISMGKDIVVLLRDTALLILAGLLLLFPARFNDLLVRAGFEEGSIVGFKWKANLIRTDESLKTSQSTIADLKAQLDKTTKALGDAQVGYHDKNISSSIITLQEENRRLTAASTEVEAAVRSTIASNASLVEQAQSALGMSGGWGVVFGSDIAIEAARVEIARAAKKGIPGSDIYFRNGYYASIAVTDNLTTAQAYLTIAKTFRPDAYISSMGTWCRNPQQRYGFFECQNRQ